MLKRTRRVTSLVLLVLTYACGLEEWMNPEGTPAAEKSAKPAAAVTSEADASRALFGEMFGNTFVPRSVIFATGINADGLEETHIVASSLPNYCEYIRDGIEQERSLRVMLRIVRYVGEQAVGHVVPGDYQQVSRPLFFNDTLGIAPPDQASLSGDTGNALTAAVARVRLGCGGQRLVAAVPGSALHIDAHDFSGLRGHVSLRFDNYGRGDSAGQGADSLNGLPVRLGGTFSATPCPWLGTILDRDPQAPFRTNQCLAQSTR